jgi:hypothetical protein
MKLLGLTITGGTLDMLPQSGICSNGTIMELYTSASGEAGLIDTVNTTSYYDSTKDTYGVGIVQTNQLYESTTEITSILTDELCEINQPSSRATIDVSFDNGSSWSTSTNNIGDKITDFTGTSSDSGTYKLKLKMTLSNIYNDGYVWVTTSSLNAIVYQNSGCGTTSDALSFAGQTGGGVKLTKTEIWSGSSWATTSALNTARRAQTGCGTTSAALCIGDVTSTEIWSGSSWATTNNLPTTTDELGSCGITSATLAMGGTTSGTKVTTTNIWSGSSWETTGALTEAKLGISACGTTAAALCFGGDTGANVDTTEIWNGSSWATTTSLTEAKRLMGQVGDTSSALCFGGYLTSGYEPDTTEIWNGSSWSTTTALLVILRQMAPAGTSTDALASGGWDHTASVDTTERWLGIGIQKGFMCKIN